MDFLPMPHSVRKGEGLFVLRYDTRIMLENTEPSAFLYAQMLQADVQRFTGLKPAILRGTAQPGDVILRADAALEETSYRLSVTTESMLVRGGSDESLLNGVMTLSQWIQRHGARLPALEIEDQPVPRDAVLVAAFVFHEQGAEIDVRNARHRLSQRDGEAVMAHVQVFVVVVNDIEIAVAEVVHGQGHETVPGVEIGLGHGADRFKRDRLGFEASN